MQPGRPNCICGICPAGILRSSHADERDFAFPAVARPASGHAWRDKPCPLLPQAPCSAKEFLAARQEWEAAGLASLDFDGALHPEPPFDRLLLHLKTGTAVLRLARDGAERLFVRGTVDTAQLRRAAAAEPWRISLRPLSL